MKLAKPAGLLLTAMMAITLGTVGCKKNPDRLTSVGGFGPNSRVGSEPEAPPIGHVPPISTPPPIISAPVPPGGDIPFNPNVDRTNWKEDRTTFANQTVYFDFDKSIIKPGEASKLEEVVRRMQSMPGKALRIEGHCDERGTEEYNRSLGDRRALSVREWLAGHGLSADLVETISYGEDKPVDPSHTESAWSKNRRGEIILLSPN